MNTQTAINRLTKTGHITKAGKIHVYDQSVIYLLKRADKTIKFYLKKWRNNGRQLDESQYWRMRSILCDLGLNYSLGNDAPKKGLEGDYIKVSVKELNKIKDVEFPL